MTVPLKEHRVVPPQFDSAAPNEVQPFSDRFFGREDEIHQIAATLVETETRLLTLTGPGGVGKTRLARQIEQAAQAAFASGSHFIALADLRDAHDVIPTIARSLGIDDETERLGPSLVSELRKRRLLLVLDNLEHLLDAGRDLIELSLAASGLTILATSRRPLGVPGELVVAVEPLSIPAASSATIETLRHCAAVRLFLARSSHVFGSAAMDQSQLADVAEICRLVDGLPLGIELAAAWTRVLSPADLVQRMGERLPRLKGGSSQPGFRHQTMRNAIAWSHDLLGDEAQRLFRRLAAFSGGFSIEMAERAARGRTAGFRYGLADGYDVPLPAQLSDLAAGIGSPHDPQKPEFALPLAAIPGDVVDLLAELLDHSMMRRSAALGNETRFEMLETIREFGLEQLTASGEMTATRHAHAAAMAAFCEASSEGLWNQSERRWDRAKIVRELPNIRAALHWTSAQAADGAELQLRIAGSLGIFWQTSGLVTEGRMWLEDALEHTSAPLWCRSLQTPWLGFLCWIQGDDERALAVLTDGLELTARARMTASEASAHFFLALVAWRQGPAGIFTMLDRLERSLELFTDSDGVVGIGVCKLALGVIARMSGDLEGALALFDETFHIHAEAGYEWGVATSRYFAGEALLELAEQDSTRLVEAMDVLRDGLTRYRAQGDNWGAGGVISAIATLLAKRGENETAARLFGAAQAMLGRIGAFLPPANLEAYRLAADELRQTMGAAAYDGLYKIGLTTDAQTAYDEANEIANSLIWHAILAQPTADPHDRLTRRQRAVVELLGRRLGPKEIAAARGRKLCSTYEMLAAICERLDVKSWEDIVPFIARTSPH